MNHIISFFFITGFTLCFFIIFSLLKTKENRLPQRLLVTFWVYILFIILTYYADLNDLDTLYVISYPFLNTSQIFLPVLVFLYIKSISYGENSFLKKNSWHLIPTIIYFFVYTIPILINYKSNKIVFNYIEQIDTVLLTLLKDSYGIIYFILSVNLLRNIDKKIKQLYSHLTEVHYLWLHKFVYTFFGVIIVDFLFTLSEFIFDYDVSWDGYIVVALLVVSMFYLAHYGIKQVTLFIPGFLFRKPESSINSSNFEALNEKLKNLLENKKPFLTPGLTLAELAEALKVSDKVLSHFLNNYLKVSFYDLINSYRVHEAKKLLKSTAIETYSISGIVNMCGFSSKSSFYRVFKKETGITPISYIKNNYSQ